MTRRAMLWLILMMTALPSRGEGSGGMSFFNLTSDEVKIDSVLPVFRYAHPIGYHYMDSCYTVAIEYPEFIDMSEGDVLRYQQLSGAPLGALPEIAHSISVNRKFGSLQIAFTPIVFRHGKYQKLVSFALKVTATKREGSSLRTAARRTETEGYATQSVLGSGQWVKISVTSTGIHQLTDDLIREAGFSDPSKVKIYGYGGAKQPELLTADYVLQTDDLKELPTCTVSGKRLFYGYGPVSWSATHQRIRNPYATYGAYFLTENDAAAKTLSWEEFLATYYPLEQDYCSLYEVDDYAWFHGGRNLYDAKILPTGRATSYTLSSMGKSAVGSLTVCVSAYTTTQGASVSVALNGSSLGKINISTSGTYDKMKTAVSTFTVSNLQASNQVTLTPNSNCGTVRLDYISTYAQEPKAAPTASQDFPVPTIMGAIQNQNRHGDPAADMVIIIPTSQKVRAQAERLKAIHAEKDGFRTNIVPANELYNEFSSGTPDANAYRRYMKMLYDRATSADDMPRYLLLFGDCAWDNRMISSAWKNYSPDDFLLCYESENSYSNTDCYVSDDYFCLLDDGEGGNITGGDQTDVGVGRITARTAEEAKTYVDKVKSYINNEQAGAWQNQLCFMGDDGNDNKHMDDANTVATMVESTYPSLTVKRIMWDAYTLVTSATGNTYPDVSRLIKQQMKQGALMMNYSGHGRADAMSHEYVLRLTDMKESTSLRLPMWLTASCDIMPFDSQEDNFGESALFNNNGGAIAFYGTTRTVYQPQNRRMNISFTRHVLDKDDSGKPYPIGEAVRKTKNELVTTGTLVGYDAAGNPKYEKDTSINRMQYSLLGDPALRLAIPTQQIEVQSINDITTTSDQKATIPAGSTATVKGRILTDDGETDTNYNGTVTGLVRDVTEEITCRLNNTSSEGASVPYVYYDRPNTIYNGSNKVTKGEFTLTFAVPMDISYSDLDAQINLYAINDDKSLEAHGVCNKLSMNGTAEQSSSQRGPSIYCYLNTPSFENGGEVNTTPYFVAELNDENGLNVSGNSIGHELQLIIDNESSKTYPLNDYFTFDFDSYTKGKVEFSIPQLDYGTHKLKFRAWDVLNNSSTTELTFNVVKSLEPVFATVSCSPNPATTSTRFRIVHDRIGTEMQVRLDVYDTSGRHLWTHSESGVPSDNTYSVDWDLTVDGGRRLNTGLYLYKLSISSEGSSYVSKANKLIILKK